MNFSDIKINNHTPLYIQIASYIKRKILRGEIEDGEPLPSRRQLAALLAINPNTVQKAFKLMEDEGYVVTPRNAPSHIKISTEILEQIEDELNHEFIKTFVAQARDNRLTYKDVIQLITKYWEDDV